MNENTTDPPPSHEARALRAIGRELDILSDAVGELSAGIQALTEMGETDARALARVEGKLDMLIAVLTGSENGLLRRTGELESWRREHELEHVRQ